MTTRVVDGGRSLTFADSLHMGLGIVETENAQSGCQNPCPDAIRLPVPNKRFAHPVGNVTYELEVLGFQEHNGALVGEMLTGENDERSLPLIARLTKTSNVVADAGPDQTVDEAAGVRLDGTRSAVRDLTYLWEQVSGPPVALDDPSSPEPGFDVGWFTEDQQLVFRLTVRDMLEPEISSSDTVRISVRDLNDPPVADAGGPYRVPEGGSTVLAGSATDPDDNVETVTWDFDGDGSHDDGTGLTPTFSAAALDGPSVHQVAVRVCDTFGVCATDTADVEVANVAPTVDLGDDVTVYRNDPVRSVGTFTDPAGALDEPYGYAWTGTGPLQPARGSAEYGASPSTDISYEIEGTYTIDLAVTDDDGGTGRDSQRVTVLNRPPSCADAASSVASLWPPQHEYARVGVVGLSDPEGDALTVTVTSIRQDEPVREPGSGNTGPDATGVGTATAELRAERSGGGDGRVYHVGFVVDDGHGGSCEGTVTVGVPHDSRGAGAVDQGPLHDSTTG
ncbi:putative exported chitinase [Blastococcus saxobsidens DD2]|uniref:Putative exported chitinase n=1 Tax=Blastococcus saxobsidens (strain DD2) TaxID=1146883 RepID=H6RUI1_BLASD|nr:putative exported chitinase [Blastococcus saxobsidens DD2]